ncbi:MAG: hypothetical protein QOI12_4208 [Alphaproteobacteria bacterium]|jgi:hypothetical protein|nr:hypothetical protein [Alphaproteobacteria bacterium]
MTIFGVHAGLLVLAFTIATFVTAVELLTSKYARTSRFVLKSAWFYVYVLIYGILGAGALALLPLLGDQVTTEGIAGTNPWIKAALIGFSVKAVLHIRIFAVSTGPGQSFPVGLESLVQLFEPWMLRTIELDHYSEQSAFITPRAAGFGTVADARSKAKTNPPPGFSAAEKAVFEADIDQAATPAQVIAAYLKYAGIKLASATFP